MRGSLARSPRKGRPEAKAVKGRHLSLPHTRNWRARGKCPCIARFAEVGRTSSCPEKHATGHERVESLIAPECCERGLSQEHRTERASAESCSR